MSLVRASLVLVQAALNQLATTPPNKSPTKGRYHTAAPRVLQIAPLIFKAQQPVLWVLAALDVLAVVYTRLAPSLPPALFFALRPLCAAAPAPAVTPLFLLGLALSLGGALLRLACYAALGPLFTFDLALHPAHALVARGPYARVRHPAYAGSLLLNFGWPLAHLLPGAGGAARACGLVPRPEVLVAGLALYWVYWMWVGWSRCLAEDAQLKAKFGKEWEAYARRVRWWYIPGVL